MELLSLDTLSCVLLVPPTLSHVGESDGDDSDGDESDGDRWHWYSTSLATPWHCLDLGVRQ